MCTSDFSQKEQLPSLNEMKSALIKAEEESLHKSYPDYDAWRAPQNIADSMGCVGYANELLNNYRCKLEGMSEEEITILYKSKAGKK